MAKIHPCPFKHPGLNSSSLPDIGGRQWENVLVQHRKYSLPSIDK